MRLATLHPCRDPDGTAITMPVDGVAGNIVALVAIITL